MRKYALLSALILVILLTAVSNSACNKKKETVTIHYAAWNLGSIDKNGLERRMVNAFMEKYPYIKVVIDETFTANYDKALKAAAADNKIPDVFMYAGNYQADTNGWCKDVTSIAERDSDWENIPKALREAAQIRGRIIGIPCSMYFYGYFYNKDLFKEKGITLPNVGLPIRQFRSVVEKMTDIKNGSIGLADESSIIEWYPAAVNPSMSWYSWDGGRFNLNSAEFKDGVKLARSICQNRQSYALLSDTEKKCLKGSNDWEAWNLGTVALKFDGTWSSNDYSKLKFKVGFIGIPGGRTCIVPDFLYISKNSKNPEEAYKFIKFMSTYSEEGFSKRIELAKANNLVVTSIPMLKNKKLIDAYFNNIKIDGIRGIYKKLNNKSYVEGNKVLPGYKQARWDYATNIKVKDDLNATIGTVITDTVRGDSNIDQIADKLNSAANECVQIYPNVADN